MVQNPIPNNKRKVIGVVLFLAATLLFSILSGCNQRNSLQKQHTYITFVFTSDAHYGIKRAKFQGKTEVDSHIVNEAMIRQINTVSGLTLPVDSGVKAGQKVGGVNFLIETGDVANREETGIQSATDSWKQFIDDYTNRVTLQDDSGKHTRLIVIPGNHDVTDAIGFYRTMVPAKDPASMVAMYNLFMHPTTPVRADTYNYAIDKIHYSLDFRGVHLAFACIWPDSAERIWLDTDLAGVKEPVLLFTHDEPDVETKHLTNPSKPGTINPKDKFENLLSEKCKDGDSIGVPSIIEQKAFALWIKTHPEIVAYFHGNDNANEFYVYRGPEKNIALNTFRVDSPMKGNYSALDETKLSFQLVTIDVTDKKLTSRECLWDTQPADPTHPIVFGAEKTISIN